MSTPFGLGLDTVVLTPDGGRALRDLRVGDAVCAWDAARRALVNREVHAVQEGTVDHLYTIGTPTARAGAVAAGTNVFDVAEDMFRGAGSLSSLSEALVWTGSAADVEAVEVADEYAAPGTPVRFLSLTGDEGAFFADGLLVRHQGRG